MIRQTWLQLATTKLSVRISATGYIPGPIGIYVLEYAATVLLHWYTRKVLHESSLVRKISILALLETDGRLRLGL